MIGNLFRHRVSVGLHGSQITHSPVCLPGDPTCCLLSGDMNHGLKEEITHRNKDLASDCNFSDICNGIHSHYTDTQGGLSLEVVTVGSAASQVCRRINFLVIYNVLNGPAIGRWRHNKSIRSRLWADTFAVCLGDHLSFTLIDMR